ncbi:hypothetical protein CKO38_13125 [Rhodospirillum rubrum]|uniref:GIY-YIG nuclease family protein n=1 Tax=Rhodospirillum rubrum TaxID=1085 RepID=UPI0019038359|nr:GIY-YIG nuclease family protein [Rhodospirillum rubrum]MBK1665728.1 hypothetical protein [Rhodospirillum rubrum]MBK1677593.1 hypothetical protein [Rhodospirillum rubrum]
MKKEMRFSPLKQVPWYAAIDHRQMLNEEGEHIVIANLPRWQRRKVKKKSNIIASKYNNILNGLQRTGIGFQVDQFIRELCFEYTYRYASSGLSTQPLNFNYFEPFCKICLIEGSTAPYVWPRNEVNNMFSVIDYLDFITSNECGEFSIDELAEMPEGIIYHFTISGEFSDFVFLTASSNNFYISGFSMIRHGNSVHYYLIGGEVLPEDKIKYMDLEFCLDGIIHENKKKFLTESVEESGGRTGCPVLLEGTENAVRTIVACEINIETKKYLGRCQLQETNHSFNVVCDDPNIFKNIKNKEEADSFISQLNRNIDECSVLWGLGASFLQLHKYFKARKTVSKFSVKKSGAPRPRNTKGGKGVGEEYKYVPSLEISDVESMVWREYVPPAFNVETTGYWKRLAPKTIGWGRDGEVVIGKSWVNSNQEWRSRSDGGNVIFVKNTIESARRSIDQYLSASQVHLDDSSCEENFNSLYVMRCVAMDEEIYKVGWTSKNPIKRAKDLSSATGVATPFSVVKYWKYNNAQELEVSVHARLDQFRVNNYREFFRADLSYICNVVENEIKRIDRKK